MRHDHGMRSRTLCAVALVAAGLGAVGCGGDDDDAAPVATAPPGAVAFYGDEFSFEPMNATIEGGEAWLDNIYIPEYTQGTWTNHAPRRKRKLLLHHHEIEQLMHGTREKGHTIVPLRLYFVDGRAKIEIALARGKKLYDKRQSLKERQDSREAERAMNARR